VNGQHIPATGDNGFLRLAVHLHKHVGCGCCRLLGREYAVDVEFTIFVVVNQEDQVLNILSRKVSRIELLSQPDLLFRPWDLSALA